MAKGEAYAEIEVMKMNMQLNALEDGTITFCKPAGAVMEPGDVICTMELKVRYLYFYFLLLLCE